MVKQLGVYDFSSNDILNSYIYGFAVKSMVQSIGI